MIDLLLSGPLLPSLAEALPKTYRVHELWRQPDRATFLQAHGAEMRAMVTSFTHGVDAAVLSDLPNLEIIANYGVGDERVDLDYARQHGILVTNTPDISEPVADIALALMLSVMRRVCEADRFVRDGKWGAGAFPFSIHLGGKTCGIVGMGRIGRAVARRAEAFGMRIAYHGPRIKADVTAAYYDDLEALARDADCLVLALPGGAETYHLVDERILAALGPAGYLVNVARGSVLDEQALARVLQDGRLAGAGLDVFETEPLVSSPLMGLENVVLLPHIGSATVDTRHAMGEAVLANLQAHFAGEPVPNPI